MATFLKVTTVPPQHGPPEELLVNLDQVAWATAEGDLHTRIIFGGGAELVIALDFRAFCQAADKRSRRARES